MLGMPVPRSFQTWKNLTSNLYCPFIAKTKLWRCLYSSFSGFLVFNSCSLWLIELGWGKTLIYFFFLSDCGFFIRGCYLPIWLFCEIDNR